MNHVYFIQVPSGKQMVDAVEEGAEWAVTASVYLVAIMMAAAVIGFAIHNR